VCLRVADVSTARWDGVWCLGMPAMPEVGPYTLPHNSENYILL